MYCSIQTGKRCVTKLTTNTFHRYVSSSIPDCFVISEEVKHALVSRKPVVALETTIVTHGMPHPQNLRMAQEVEDLVRTNGSIPAAIGIIGGKVHVGLSQTQLEFLADPSTTSIKTSRRDLPFILSQKLHGGTTVSGTMLIAHMVGIPLFVTGGIGGVHRGGENSLDVSADLRELGRTPVTVVSSGVKSILDIGRTLEFLETEGVCVASFGKTHDFPAFFSRNSGHEAPYKVGTTLEAAKLIYSNGLLGIQTGTLIGVPIPEQFDTLGQEIETLIQSVIVEAQEAKIQGKEITPYILSRVNERTGGKSLEANIQLVKNNAVVGSQIAVELARLHHKEGGVGSDTGKTTGKLVDDVTNFSVGAPSKAAKVSKTGKKVTVVGGSIVDFYANMTTDDFKINGATYAGQVKQTFGGVGRNMADGLCRLGVDTRFISAIGLDSHTSPFESHCSHMDLSHVQRLQGHSTATYCAVLGSSGELLFGIGDMEIHKQITPQLVSQFESTLVESDLVCLDGNIPDTTIQYVCETCRHQDIPVLFDPTDIHKSMKPFQTSAHKGLAFTTPNFNELKMMASYLTGSPVSITGSADDLAHKDVLHECVGLLDVVSNYIPVVLVTLGKHGVILCHHGDSRSRPFEIKRQGSMTMEHFPAVPENSNHVPILSVSGAGDCMIAAMVSYLLEGQPLEMAVKAGLLASQISLQSMLAVPTTLTAQAVNLDSVHRFMDVQSSVLK